MPLYVEEINMLEGLEDTELEAYLDGNPQIIPLFEMDVLEAASEYAPTSMRQDVEHEPDPESLLELSKAQEAFEQEMEISWQATTSMMEKINVGSVEAPRPLSIAKDPMPTEKIGMIDLLWEYKDVFAWSYDDMKGLDTKFYQHKINLATVAKSVQ